MDFPLFPRRTEGLQQHPLFPWAPQRVFGSGDPYVGNRLARGGNGRLGHMHRPRSVLSLHLTLLLCVVGIPLKGDSQGCPSCSRTILLGSCRDTQDFCVDGSVFLLDPWALHTPSFTTDHLAESCDRTPLPISPLS